MPGKSERDYSNFTLDEMKGELETVYHGLREIARRMRRRNERLSHTLQTTAAINEALKRMLGSEAVRGKKWDSLNHFYSYFTTCVRRVLIDYARIRRGQPQGRWHRVELDDAMRILEASPEAFIRIDEILVRGFEDPKRAPLARVAIYRIFTPLKITDIAAALEVSEPTVKRRWRAAKEWLREELEIEA